MERSRGGGAGVAGPGAEFADETYRLERVGVYVAVVPGAVTEAVACETNDELRMTNVEVRMESARALAENVSRSKFAKARRLRQHARARALPREISHDLVEILFDEATQRNMLLSR